MNPKPYLKYVVWKDKRMKWCATVYIYAGVMNKNTRAEAVRALDLDVKKMEHVDCSMNSKCCTSRREGTMSGYLRKRRSTNER